MSLLVAPPWYGPFSERVQSFSEKDFFLETAGHGDPVSQVAIQKCLEGFSLLIPELSAIGEPEVNPTMQRGISLEWNNEVFLDSSPDGPIIEIDAEGGLHLHLWFPETESMEISHEPPETTIQDLIRRISSRCKK
jgi:hypothetical protein